MQRQVRQLIAARSLAGSATRVAALIAVVVAPMMAWFGAAAAAESPAAPTARVEKDAYVVEIVSMGETRAGVPATFEARMAARGTYHVNADYPSSFKVTAGSDEVSYPRTKVDRSSGLAYEKCTAAGSTESCGVRAQVPFVAGRAGTHTVGGLFAFSVCDKEQCLIEKVTLALPVTVR
jgi:hypothetical protein